METTLGKPKSKAQEKREEVATALRSLAAIIHNGDTVYTTLKHVSRSGMYRRISVIAHGPSGDIRNVSWAVARVLGERYCRDDDSVGVSGCGMDMGFHLVYALGCALFPNGHECCGREKCHSNDHSNGDRNYEPHLHRDGGYALRHAWL